jgi:hypothetical protein
MILGFIIGSPQEKKPLERALFLAETEVRPSTLEMSKRVAHANGVSILTFVSFLILKIGRFQFRDSSANTNGIRYSTNIGISHSKSDFKYMKK